MSKRSKFCVLVFQAVILSILFYFYQPYPFKVTDPTDPRFNPDRFRFSDYGPGELKPAFRILFPIGTSKEFVERVLIKATGSTCGHNPKYTNLWTCREPWSFRHWDIQPVFTIVYDEQSEYLLNITFSGNSLYPYSPKSEDFLGK
jgi:hypothetical protein